MVCTVDMKKNHLDYMFPFSAECKTTPRAKDPNKKCQFPFVYRHVTHHKCTRHGNSDTSWCATKNSPTYREDGKWGYCGPDCPKEKCKKKYLFQNHQIWKIYIFYFTLH